MEEFWDIGENPSWFLKFCYRPQNTVPLGMKGTDADPPHRWRDRGWALAHGRNLQPASALDRKPSRCDTTAGFRGRTLLAVILGDRLQSPLFVCPGLSPLQFSLQVTVVCGPPGPYLGSSCSGHCGITCFQMKLALSSGFNTTRQILRIHRLYCRAWAACQR